MTGARKTRSTTVVATPSQTIADAAESPALDDLRTNLRSPTEFVNIYNQYYEDVTLRSSFVNNLCHILADSTYVHLDILQHILDSFRTNHDTLLVEITETHLKQDI